MTIGGLVRQEPMNVVTRERSHVRTSLDRGSSPSESRNLLEEWSAVVLNGGFLVPASHHISLDFGPHLHARLLLRRTE